MIPSSLARRYARALLGLAKDTTARDKFARDLNALSDATRTPDTAGTTIASVLESERVPFESRKALIRALAKRVSADPTVVRFVEVVLQNRRAQGLAQIARAYNRLADNAANRVHAQIVSAAALPADAVQTIQRALEQATGKQVVVAHSVDASLIGGVRVTVGSYVLDGSVRATLDRLKQELRS